MNKAKLTLQEFSILSKISKINKKVLVQLSNQGLLEIKHARAIIIECEYQKSLHASNKSKTHIVKHLAFSYNMSVSSIEKIIYNKKRK